jgi:GrpB protein
VRKLAFRDRLRRDPQMAGRYAALKHRLAIRHAHDREQYTDAKAEFIRRALDALARGQTLLHCAISASEPLALGARPTREHEPTQKRSDA